MQYCFISGWSLYSTSGSHLGLGPLHLTAKAPSYQSCFLGSCLNNLSTPSSPHKKASPCTACSAGPSCTSPYCTPPAIYSCSTAPLDDDYSSQLYSLSSSEGKTSRYQSCITRADADLFHRESQLSSSLSDSLSISTLGSYPALSSA